MGTIAAAAMGDPNASIPTPQPVHYRPMFGAYGRSLTKSSVVFVSEAALANGIAAKYGLGKQLLAVKNTRGGISKASLIHNNATPESRSTPRPTRSGRMASSSPASRRRSCRWPSGISCSECPHPALRATFSRKREKDSDPLLPLAGKGARRADEGPYCHITPKRPGSSRLSGEPVCTIESNDRDGVWPSE